MKANLQCRKLLQTFPGFKQAMLNLFMIRASLILSSKYEVVILLDKCSCGTLLPFAKLCGLHIVMKAPAKSSQSHRLFFPCTSHFCFIKHSPHETGSNSGIEETFSRLTAAISKFSEKQFSTPFPFEGSWTAGQVAEHIIKSIGGMPDQKTQPSDRAHNEKIEAIRKNVS